MKKALLAASAAALGLLAEGAVPSTSSLAWEGYPKCGQAERHEEKMKLVAAGGAKVVFVGDSITHFAEDKPQWRKYFGEGDARALNLGISGDRTEHVLWRIDNGELDGYEAKCVVLLIGTNNTGHRPFEKEPPIATILGIRAILGKIREKQPNAVVVLNAIFPRGVSPDDPLRRRNDIVNRELHKLCDGRKVFWCDISDMFLDRAGILQTEFFPDLLHPSPTGYEIWFSAIKPYVDYALSDGSLPAPANRFAAVAARGTSSPDAPQAAQAVTRDDGQRTWWIDCMAERREKISDCGGEIDLVFLGDSITHAWLDVPKWGLGAKSLRELEKKYSVLVAGFTGDRTEHLLWRAENGDLDGYRAKCVMLMIGTNNACFKHTSPEDVARGIRDILDAVARKQPQAKTLLLPIFPRGGKPNDKYRVFNEKVNALIRPYADGDRVIWVDLRSRFLDGKGAAKNMRDKARLHPNEEGYRVWTEAVLPYFKKICGR